MYEEKRLEKAKLLIKDIIKLDNNNYSIKNKDYIITVNKCTCIDHRRGNTCKHIIAVRLFLQENKKVIDETKLKELTQYLKENGDVRTDYKVYEKFDDEFINDVIELGLIIKTGRSIILIK